MTRHLARQLDFETLVDGMTAAFHAQHVSRVYNDGLTLYVYTKSATYERAWNTAVGEFVKLARGLVIDHETRRVVATPFPKFFNLHEPEAGSLPNEPFEVFEKLDGSLAIVFHHGGRWRAATKGSFTSDQAKWAESQIAAVVEKFPGVLQPGTTYLFEAIYPENRIVIRYPAEMTGLHLLAAYDAEGKEMHYVELKALALATEGRFRVVRRRDFASIADLLERTRGLPPDEEGWVVRFASGHRVKLKGEAYLAIHRAVSRLTPLAVWEALKEGEIFVEEMRRALPEEFWPDFDRIIQLLLEQYDERVMQLSALEDATEELSDKDLGLALQNGEFSGPLARLIFVARKKPREVPAALWDLVRPTGNRLKGYVPTSGVSRVQEETGE